MQNRRFVLMFVCKDNAVLVDQADYDTDRPAVTSKQPELNVWAAEFVDVKFPSYMSDLEICRQIADIWENRNPSYLFSGLLLVIPDEENQNPVTIAYLPKDLAL